LEENNNNPKYPVNNADPAHIAYHYKANIINKEQWDKLVEEIKNEIIMLQHKVKALEDFSFLVGVEHKHD